MADEWASFSNGGVRKSPGFDAAMRRVAADLAAADAANPVPAEERLRRTLDHAGQDLRSARMHHQRLLPLAGPGRWLSVARAA